MRLFLFLAIQLVIPHLSLATEYITKDIRKDFGAYGDGVHNDHEAFQKATDFFNQRKGYGTLVIPAGIYIVGKQLPYGALVPELYSAIIDEGPANPFYKVGLPVLYFSGCRELSIQGEKGSVIKFADNLMLGGFDNKGAPIPLKDKKGNVLVPEREQLALIGEGILLESCKDIKIRDVELDGNAPNLLMGGNVSADGWQWGQSGVVMVDVNRCSIENVSVHHFAVDGLQLRNTTAPYLENIADQDIILSNSSFDYNGRQGFSWTGGAGVTAINCSFSHTGRAYNKSIKKELSTAPGAGMDIEPESDPDINVYRLVRNGIFKNCSFINNSGAAMVADLYDATTARVAQDIAFDSCTFWGTTFWSVWVSHPGFSFNQCHIYGSPAHSFAGRVSGKETRFLNCHFEDKTYITDKGKKLQAYGNYLVEIADGTGTLFDGCTFTSHKKPFYYLVASYPDDSQSKFKVTNCKFIDLSGTGAPKNCIAEGVVFRGSNPAIDK